mgnify:CR=1 FL=1|tara:strand:- start:1409 stop:2110 length:702 start_codon:yes stop_codon:yes gene_type:complete
MAQKSAFQLQIEKNKLQKEADRRAALDEPKAAAANQQLQDTMAGSTYGAGGGAGKAYNQENAQMYDYLRDQLMQSTDFGAIRQDMQQELMDKTGAAMRGMQTAASRGGVAGRGGGTGALRAPAQQALVRGMRGIEADIEGMKGQRMQQVAAANAANVTSQLSQMGYDSNKISMALTLKEKSLDKVMHRIDPPDPQFTPVLLQAEANYQKNIAEGMDIIEASMIFDAEITMTQI